MKDNLKNTGTPIYKFLFTKYKGECKASKMSKNIELLYLFGQLV